MTGVDTRLSAPVVLTDDAERIEKDGPRSLWRTYAYCFAACAECNASARFDHRMDAEDWLDAHHCEDAE